MFHKCKKPSSRIVQSGEKGQIPLVNYSHFSFFRCQGGKINWLYICLYPSNEFHRNVPMHNMYIVQLIARSTKLSCIWYRAIFYCSVSIEFGTRKHICSQTLLIQSNKILLGIIHGGDIWGKMKILSLKITKI